MSLNGIGIALAERGLVPDGLIRKGIRSLCAKRLERCVPEGDEQKKRAVEAFAERMREGPVAPVPESANEQHYEVPESFFGRVLGHRRKYSSCYWGDGAADLNQAEDDALRVTCERAEVEDGMSVLELGCGWGSLTLWMAQRYPASTITAVSNSHSQRAYIMSRAEELGLGNVEVITCDMNDFDTDRVFDRAVSIEMFEHMRNYELLLSRVASWLKPDGKLFVHIFAHKDAAYAFETRGADNWLGRYFFTGGIMPALNLMHEFGSDLGVEREWVWDGTHYQKTSEAWLENLDANKDAVVALFAQTMGAGEARKMYHRWRIFFLACAECFGYKGGGEWVVGHYLLSPSARDAEQADARAQLVGGSA
jgi:cyclopropane-fatty-acyl-phospholipid synthase